MRRALLSATPFLLAACSPVEGQIPIAGAPAVAQPTEAQAGPTSNAAPGPAAGNLVFVAGSTEKVCQLTGDVDWQTGSPTAARTFTNFGLDAVDLGFPVGFQGKLMLVLGDTWPPRHSKNETAQQSEVPPDDSVVYTVRTGPDV